MLLLDLFKHLVLFSSRWQLLDFLILDSSSLFWVFRVFSLDSSSICFEVENCMLDSSLVSMVFLRLVFSFFRISSSSFKVLISMDLILCSGFFLGIPRQSIKHNACKLRPV